MHAAMYGSTTVTQALLSRSDVDLLREDCRGRRALSYAAQRGHVEVVKLLLERTMDPNYRDMDGRTALSLAAERGRVAVVQTMLQQPVTIDISPDVSGKTPMDYATEQRRLWDEVMLGDHWEAYDEILLALDRYKFYLEEFKEEEQTLMIN